MNELVKDVFSWKRVEADLAKGPLISNNETGLNLFTFAIMKTTSPLFVFCWHNSIFNTFRSAEMIMFQVCFIGALLLIGFTHYHNKISHKEDREVDNLQDFVFIPSNPSALCIRHIRPVLSIVKESFCRDENSFTDSCLRQELLCSSLKAEFSTKQWPLCVFGLRWTEAIRWTATRPSGKDVGHQKMNSHERSLKLCWSDLLRFLGLIRVQEQRWSKWPLEGRLTTAED